MGLLKNKVYNIIRDDDKNNLASNIFDGFIISLIIINVIMVILDTFTMPDWYQSLSAIIEVISVIIFSIEYVLRIWTSTYIYPNRNPLAARLRYMVSFMAIVDLMSVLPFYIPVIIPVDLRVLRALRMIRLLRLFKVNRYTSSLKLIGHVFREKSSQLLSSFFVIFVLMIITSVLMCDIEKSAQPEKFSNAISGLWWAVATFTTVGYGDIYPITTLGKFLSGVIAILGIGLVAVPTGIISAGFIESIDEQKHTKEERETDDKCYCPYCGKKLK